MTTSLETLSYRAARGSDALSCAQIIRDWGAETPWMVPIDEIDAVAASWHELLETDTAWVAEFEDRVLGFCVREDDNITGLYIQGDMRSHGVGKSLLDLAKQDRDWITVWVYEENARAVAFYLREGLVEVGREKDEHSHLMYVETRWRRPT